MIHIYGLSIQTDKQTLIYYRLIFAKFFFGYRWDYIEHKLSVDF